MKAGVDGIHVSNVGGRSKDSSRDAIECLPEIARVARGKLPIHFDSSIRHGTDIAKALALGASAVCIGRPYLWRWEPSDSPASKRVLEILREELAGVMKLGAPGIADLVPGMVIKG